MVIDLPQRDRPVLWLILLTVLLGLVITPRFDRHDWLISRFTSSGSDATTSLADAAAYINTVEWIQGDLPSDSLTPPWCYRIVVPAAASILPAPPLTGINIVNVLALVGTLLILYQIMRRSGLPMKESLWGCLLFVVSFPTFFYGTIGYLEPALLLVLAAGLYALLSRQWLAATMLIVAGLAVKEGVIILVPVLAIALYSEYGFSRKTLFWLGLTIGGCGLVWTGLRQLIPAPEAFQWGSSFEQFRGNVVRIRSWLTLFLSAAPLFLPLILAAVKRKRLSLPAPSYESGLLYAGLITSSGYYVYSWFTAYVDGRMFWPAYIFLIPLAMLVWFRTMSEPSGEA